MASVNQMRGFQVDVIKRGSGIFYIHCPKRFRFLDARNFTSGGSLSSFARTYGVTVPKGLFPYERYVTVSEMERAKSWPCIKSFKSHISNFKPTNIEAKLAESYKFLNEKIDLTPEMFIKKLCLTGILESHSNGQFKLKPDINLKRHFPVCPVDYAVNYADYENLKAEDKISNMHDFLCYYNVKDTEILSEAFGNLCESFRSDSNTNPLEFLSLPSVAQSIMWSMYDSNINSAYCFAKGDESLNLLIPNNIRGGLTSVFMRHAEIGRSGDRKYNDAVYQTDDGKPFTEVQVFDFNSKKLLSCR